MSNEENQFEWQTDSAPAADAEASGGASSEAPEADEKEVEAKDEVTEPKKAAEPANEFDYSETIDKMDADASLSDDSESGDDDAESDSSGDAKEGAESKSGAPKSGEATQEQMFRAAQLGLSLEDVKDLDGRGIATAIRIAEKIKPADDAAEGDKGKEGGGEEPLFTPITMELDEFDEDTQGLVKGLQDQFNANMEKMAEKLKATQDILGQSQESTAQQNQAQFFEAFDKRVTDLGEEWVDVFGSDPNKLGRETPEVQNRIRLITEMDRLSASHPELDQQGLFDKAMLMEFSEQIETRKTQKKRAKTAKFRQDRTTQRPTQRNRSIENMPDGREKALATVKKIGKKKFFGLF